MVDGVRVDGVGIEDGFADIAKGGVHHMYQFMNHWRLVIAGNDDTCTQMLPQIICDRPEETHRLRWLFVDTGLWEGQIGQRARHSFNLGCPNRESMIRLRAR